MFRERQHGESKLDARIALDFAALMLAKLTNDAVSFRFLLFCVVGLTGIVVHMAVLHGRARSAGPRLQPGPDRRDGERHRVEFRPQQSR